MTGDSIRHSGLSPSPNPQPATPVLHATTGRPPLPAASPLNLSVRSCRYFFFAGAFGAAIPMPPILPMCPDLLIIGHVPFLQADTGHEPFMPLAFMCWVQAAEHWAAVIFFMPLAGIFGPANAPAATPRRTTNAVICRILENPFYPLGRVRRDCGTPLSRPRSASQYRETTRCPLAFHSV